VRRVRLAVASGLLLVAGCGSSGASTTPVPGAGQGVGYALRADGMQRCAGPLSAVGDPSRYSGAPSPATLAVYAEPGFAAIVASGAGAQEHAVNLAVIRNHVATNISPATVAGIERSWRREAIRALRGPGVPLGLCKSQVPRFPVLSATEVMCSDEVLIPLGRNNAMSKFVGVLSSFLHVDVTPDQYVYLQNGGWLTIPGSTNVTRPYCHS
jgi:hypothetical protein